MDIKKATDSLAATQWEEGTSEISDFGEYKADIDLLADELFDELKKSDDAASYLGSGLVKDPTKNVCAFVMLKCGRNNSV